jgi:succinoglycan biosynthesis transport protein ExoP
VAVKAGMGSGMDNIGVGLADFWHVLRRRMLRLCLAAILGAALAVAISEALPVHYTSEALLEVEAHTPLMKEMNPGATATTPDQVRTEADILESRALTESIVRDLKLMDAADFKSASRPPTWTDRIYIGLQEARSYALNLLGLHTQVDPLSDAVDLFQRRLQVVANEKSHIVAVRVQTGSAQLSADVVNNLLTRYLSNQVAGNLSVSAQENQWLTEHLAALQHDVDEAALRAQAFRDANGLMDIQAGALPAVQLNEKEQNLSAARQELSKAQAAFDSAAKALQTGSGFVGQEVLGSLLIQRLREREADVLQRMANLRQRTGDSTPYLAPLQAELASARAQIAVETGHIVNALRRDVDLARDRVNSLQTMVTDSQVRAQRNAAAADTLTRLTQEVDAKRHVYIAFLTRMEQTQLASTQFPTARVVSPAVPPFKADGMPPIIVAILGAVAAVFLAIAALLLRWALDRRVTSVANLEVLTGATPICAMPALPGAGGLPVAMRILDMNQSGVVETLYALRFAVLAMNPGASCTRVLVTSASPEEGKTTLAASLARLTAASGMRVLLVEADLRRPTLRRMLRMSPRNSIESFLTQGMRLADAVHVDPKSGLHCLTADGSAPNAVTTLQSPRLSALMEEAQASYDMVIIDSPPVMRVVDALILAHYSDVILFAVAYGRIHAATVLEALRRFPSHVRSRIATVLTRVPQTDISWEGYYAGYKRKLPASA